MKIKSNKDLIVWQKSMELVKVVFILTKLIPQSELYGLISQMRRATIAIASNIAEGYGRRSTKSYIQFYAIAYGSMLELEIQLLLVKDLSMAEEKEFEKSESLLEEVCKMLNSIISKLKALPTNA